MRPCLGESYQKPTRRTRTGARALPCYRPGQNVPVQGRLRLFGLNTAPQLFNCLGHPVAGHLHRQGISLIPYMNDWLVHPSNRDPLLYPSVRFAVNAQTVEGQTKFLLLFRQLTTDQMPGVDVSLFG